MLIGHRHRLIRAAALIAAVLAGLICTACEAQKELQFSGKTMGTTYRIKLVAGRFTSATDLQKQVDKRLAAINKSMSTYDPTSEISRFNAIDSTSQRLVPSADFFNVLQVAAEIHRLTEGAWDGTLDPLVNLWGFGRGGSVNHVPDDRDIQQALTHVGFDRIRLDPSGSVAKADPAVKLDLASIAKGYGVDEISRLLGGQGFSHFLVEIGGEVYARGLRKDGNPWQVGINRPEKAAALKDVYKTVPLTDQAMATSGDYRIFFTIGNQSYSHILDPRTGRPVSNQVVSATVVAANCTVADALSTALMVMGPENGVALVDQLTAVECLIVVRHTDGGFRDYPSSGFIIH